MSSIAETPEVLAVGGLEPSGRMGLLADLETARASGCAPSGLATLLTAQGGPFRVERVRPALLAAQLEGLFAVGRPRAIKLGAVGGLAQLRVLETHLWPLAVPTVVDPVARTSRGETLSRLGPKDYLALARPFVVITPNALELGWLLGKRRPPSSPDEALGWGGVLLERGFGAVVVKGGHLRGPGERTTVDWVLTGSGVKRLSGRHIARDPVRHRGTGCRFGTALACGLAKGSTLPEAARAAKRHVARYLRQ